MTTTPLSPIVQFLRKHGASLACLEGAPIEAPTFAPFDLVGHLALPVLSDAMADHACAAGVALYLGASTVCPAALGWASEVLALARGWTEPDLMIYGEDVIGLRGWEEGLFHEWQWRPSDPSLWDDDVDTDLITVMPGPTPTTPAGRLKAVLEYEALQ